MKITSINLRMIHRDNGLRSIISIVLDDMIAIHDIKLIEKDHMFLAMPSKKLKDNTFVDIAHPINKPTRNALEKLLCEAYDITLKTGFDYISFVLRDDCDVYDASIHDYIIDRGDVYEID
ncbi:MAG: SpoVG family protein [Erysipelotrichaceae bacterium]|nr:SpoVG family protein [Erysipelotrichaceae bacterium]